MPARSLLRLTLVRHAKTEPGRPGQEDWDRALESRGQRLALHRQTREILEQKVEHGAAARNPYSFTFRELTVLHLLVSGEPDKQIARQLNLEVSTIKNHVHSIIVKLSVKNRIEAAALMRAGTGQC